MAETKPQNRHIIDSAVFAAIVVLLFGVACGLAFYSSNQIAATWGSRGLNPFESLCGWLSIILQPWFIVIFWVWEMFCFIFRLDANFALVPAIASALVLFYVLKWVSRRSIHVSRAMVILILILVAGNTYVFIRDLQMLKEHKNIEPVLAP